MPRLLRIGVFSLMFASTVLAQTRTVPGPTTPVPLPPVGGGTTLPAQPPVPASGPGFSQVDNNGNLLVFDTSYTYPQGETPSPGIRRTPVPTTHVTVVLSGGAAPSTREYAGVSFQLVGVGQWGTYAIMTTFVQDQTRVSVVRRLIAINAGASGGSLPQSAEGFVSTDIADGVGRVDVVRAGDRTADTLYAVAGSGASRSATIYKYAGGAFSSMKIDLP